MSVLVLAESPKGMFKKAAFEAVHYGHKAAQSLGGDCIALVIGAADNAGVLGTYGASKVIQVADYSGGADASAYANICLLYTSPSPRDRTRSRMPSSA